jgi:hypothetical protein
MTNPTIVAVGLDSSHPRDELVSVDDLGKEGIGEGLGHGGDEGLLGLVGGEPPHVGVVVDRHLDESQLRRGQPGASAPRLPVAPEHAVDVVVGAFAVEPERQAGVALEEEPGPLEHLGRGDVVGVQHAEHPAHPEILEQVGDQRLDGLVGVSLAPMARRQRVADLGRPPLAREMEGEVAERGVGVGIGDDEHPPLVGGGAVHRHELAHHRRRPLPGEGRGPVLVVGHPRIVAARRQGGGVVTPEGPEQEAAGTDRVEHERHSTPLGRGDATSFLRGADQQT